MRLIRNLWHPKRVRTYFSSTTIHLTSFVNPLVRVIYKLISGSVNLQLEVKAISMEADSLLVD